MLSASSSSSFSTFFISSSMWAITALSRFSFSITLSSRSNSFIAYHLCCSSGILCTAASSMWAIVCSTGPENVCIGTVLPFLAASTAASAASFIPVPLRAEISTTLHPSSLESSSMFILSPFFFTISIILMAITTGMPSSVSCVVR